jgi:enoyl-CoA hydratase/carnithine racemase
LRDQTVLDSLEVGKVSRAPSASCNITVAGSDDLLRAAGSRRPELTIVDDDGDVEDEATELMLDVVENSSPQAYRVMKSIMKQWSNIAMLGWESQRELTASVWRSKEFQERAEAFMAKEEAEQLPFMGSSPDRDNA